MTQKLRFQTLERFGFGPNVMKMTRICPRCAQAVKTKADVCPECGERLPRETLFDRYKRQHRSCPDCDAILSRDCQYCPNCGKQLLQKAAGFPNNMPNGGKTL